MPKKYAKKPYKKTYQKRKTFRKSPTTNVQRGLSPIAARTITKLKYVGLYERSLTDSTLDQYSFRLNSLFDPDLTGTGHQPLGFDQIKLFYTRYRVFSVDWVLQVSNRGDQPVRVACIPHNATSITYSNMEHVCESPRAQHRHIGYNTGNGTCTMRGHCNLPSINGVTSSVYKSDDAYQAQISSSPTEQIDLSIFLLTTASINVQYTIQFMFHAEFFDPIALTQS